LEEALNTILFKDGLQLVMHFKECMTHPLDGSITIEKGERHRLFHITKHNKINCPREVHIWQEL
jgi:hypothetical protein